SNMPQPLPIDLNTAIAHGLRPDWFCRDRLGFEPDPWQARLLRSRSKQIILCMGRQVGKSTTVAALALHTCLYTPGGLVLVIAPSQRPSRELFIKIHDFLQKLEPPETLEEETKLSLVLGNGSRAVVLPGDGRTIVTVPKSTLVSKLVARLHGTRDPVSTTTSSSLPRCALGI